MIYQSGSLNPSKVALLVVGVGRSGTSALSRVLSLLGAALPRDIMSGGTGNERGHWEPNRLVALNDEILKLHGSSWHDPRVFQRGWFKSIEAERFVVRAAEIIDDEYGAKPLIVIKDPRLCRLAPICLAALERIGYSSRVIIPLRHPSEIIGSLSKRDGTDPATSELIWIRHTLEAEAATRDSTRVWITYDGLLGDWRIIQARIATKLGIQWPNRPESVVEAVSAFLEPTLRHFNTRSDSRPVAVGPVAVRLWEAAQAGVTGHEETLRIRFDTISSVIDEIDRLGAAQGEANATQVEADKLAAAAEISALATALADKTAELELLRNQSAQAAIVAEQKRLADDRDHMEHAHELSLLRQNISVAVARCAAQEAETNNLAKLLAAREQALNVILTSRSWQLTDPLRRLNGAVHQLMAAQPRRGWKRY